MSCSVERGDVPVRFDTAWSGEKAGVAYVYEQQSPELAESSVGIRSIRYPCIVTGRVSGWM